MNRRVPTSAETSNVLAQVGERPVEVRGLFGKHGARAHVQARPRRKNGDR